jgi:hypothetical protein
MIRVIATDAPAIGRGFLLVARVARVARVVEVGVDIVAGDELAAASVTAGHSIPNSMLLSLGDNGRSRFRRYLRGKAGAARAWGRMVPPLALPVLRCW